ncbi:MAG: FISUMP domain-containing protein [Chitinophagales bacterium]
MKRSLALFYLLSIGALSLVHAQAAYQLRPVPTVQIGNQVWMTVNWDYPTPKSFFYDNDSLQNASYGKLYYYSNALAAAPPGWHLPTLDEWMELIDSLGGLSRAAEPMFADCDTCLHLLKEDIKVPISVQIIPTSTDFWINMLSTGQPHPMESKLLMPFISQRPPANSRSHLSAERMVLV